MKNIIRLFAAGLFVSMAMTSCYDEMDSKDSVDASHVVTNIPTLAMNSASVIDFSSASVSGTVSDVNGVIEVGFKLSTSADFSTDMKTFAAEDVAASFTQTIGGLDEKTTYYVKMFAFLADGRIVESEAGSFTTPEAPKFTLDLLDGKKYTAKAEEYFGKELSFDITIVCDKDEPNKVWFCNLCPYFANNGFTADKGFNQFYGIYDEETMTIRIPEGQKVGYQDVALTVFDNADPDVAENNSEYLPVSIVSNGNVLKLEYSFGFNDEGGFYSLYYGGITLNAK